MNTVDTNAISKSDLRKFGIIFSCMLVLFFGLLIPFLWGQESWPRWPWIVSGIFFACAIVYPLSLGPVYFVWMKIAAVLGWVNTRLILSLIFYLMFFPIGLIMRLFYDPMQRKLETREESYRTPSTSPKIENIEKPY